VANSKTVTASKIAAATATDPAVCRVSGYLRDIQNNILKAEAITIRHIYNPFAVGSDTLILQERLSVKSDSTGLITFDLYQGAIRAENEIERIRLFGPGKLRSRQKRVC